MKGNNNLTLSPATMIEVVQLWLNQQMPHDTPRVTAVEQLSTAGYMGGCFEVKMTGEIVP